MPAGKHKSSMGKFALLSGRVDATTRAWTRPSSRASGERVIEQNWTSSSRRSFADLTNEAGQYTVTARACCCDCYGYRDASRTLPDK